MNWQFHKWKVKSGKMKSKKAFSLTLFFSSLFTLHSLPSALLGRIAALAIVAASLPGTWQSLEKLAYLALFSLRGLILRDERTVIKSSPLVEKTWDMKISPYALCPVSKSAGGIPSHPLGQATWLEKETPQDSFGQVIQGKVPVPKIKDKKATGFSPLQTFCNWNSPATEVDLHPGIVNHLLQHNYLKILLNNWELVYLLLGGPILSFTISNCGAGQRQVAILALCCAWGMLTMFLFQADYLLPLAVPLVLFSLTGGAAALQERLRINAQLKMSEERLQYQAFHDKLTGLPNRALFLQHLQRAAIASNQSQDGNVCQTATHASHAQFAVLCLDLDRFKVINESLGHNVGDQLLVAFAQRLSSCLRPTDTIARLGGDEFTILLENIQDISDATCVAQQIQEAIGEPFHLNGLDIFITASIGIALGSAETKPQSDRQENESSSENDKIEESDSALSIQHSCADLLRDADIAMYQAKTQGKARYAVFDKTLHSRALALLQLETDLRRAVGDLLGERKKSELRNLKLEKIQSPLFDTLDFSLETAQRPEFRIYYQPIVSFSTGRIAGFEALVRLWHPQRGLISPMEFIPLAEETRLIASLDEWVLRESCYQLRVWLEAFPTTPPLTMSVNLSGIQFSRSGLIEQIDQVLQETGLESSRLRLEITETCLMDNAERAIALLDRLRALGIKVGIDDFGTGYSSLGRLHLLPIDTLKIDRSFVSRMCDADGSLEIVRTIVILAHNLGMDVVAEGVETAEHMAQLKSLQCDCGQGYFFSRPVDAETVEALMAQYPQW